MTTVYLAEAPRSGALGSRGNASCMLVTQHQFPHDFDENLDLLIARSHDRIRDQDLCRFEQCLQRHIGQRGELGLEHWFSRASTDKVFAFLVDMLEDEGNTQWTGYRVLGSVNGSGHAVYTLTLFAKHPNSSTEVFDTLTAPHLFPGSRWA